MALAVVYTTVNGQIASENRGGTERDYMPDTLGSTAALLDSTQAKTDTWEYWPYGEVAARTGSNATPFTFVGTLGYFKDLLDELLYVRARHYQPNRARWLTVDPLWPYQPPFGYASGRPLDHTDYDGMQAGGSGENFGECGVFLCTEHSFDFDPIQILPSHQFVCVRGPHGGCSGGNYAGGIGNEREGCSASNPPKQGTTCRKVSSDCDVANAMCKCIRVASRTGYPYTLIFNNCFTFPDEMWRCACTVMRASGFSFSKCSGNYMPSPWPTEYL